MLSEGPQPGQGVLRLRCRPAGGDAATVTARGCRAHGDGSEAGGAAVSWSAGSRRWLPAPGNPGAEDWTTVRGPAQSAGLKEVKDR